MRILHIAIGFTAPQGLMGPVTVGGISNIIRNNARVLVTGGHEVTVWTTNRLDQRRKFGNGTVHHILDGIDVWHLDTYCVPFWSGTFGPSYSPELRRKIKRELNRFDVIHLNEFRSYMAILVSRAARARRIPYVIQPHGSTDVLPFYNSRALKHTYDAVLGRRILRKASAVIAGQDDEHAKLLKLGLSPEKVHVISNGIEPEVSNGSPPPGFFRKQHGIAQDEPLILFVGRFERRKGADILVRAFAKLNGSRARLAMVGPDDGAMSEVRELVRESRLEERVVFTGGLVGDDLRSAYIDADVFAFPSRFDIFPMTILEACAAGKPMVVSNSCPLSSWLKDIAALTVPPEPAAFASALDQLLANSKERARFSEGAKSLVLSKFSLAVVVDKLEKLYRNVASAATS